MPEYKQGQCPKCKGKNCPKENCTNLKYIYNRDLQCGCDRKSIQFKNEFTDTHCCKCKKAICIYKMNNEYHCKEGQKNINNNKYSKNLDSQETIQQWNDMEQEYNQPTTSYA